MSIASIRSKLESHRWDLSVLSPAERAFLLMCSLPTPEFCDN